MRISEKIRVWDYIIFFVLLGFLYTINIHVDGSFVGPLMLAIVAAIVSSLVLGTITNFIFKKKNINETA